MGGPWAGWAGLVYNNPPMGLFSIAQPSPFGALVSLLIKDGSERLPTVLKSKDAFDMDRATILIEGGNAKGKSIGEQLPTVTYVYEK